MVMDYASWMVRFRLLPKTQGYPEGTPVRALGTTVEIPFRMLVNAPDRLLLEWFQDHPKNTQLYLHDRPGDLFPDDLVCVVDNIVVVLTTTAVAYGQPDILVRVSCYRRGVGHIASATFNPGEWNNVRRAIWNCVKKAGSVF
jgi:hypothetical protein